MLKNMLKTFKIPYRKVNFYDNRYHSGGGGCGNGDRNFVDTSTLI